MHAEARSSIVRRPLPRRAARLLARALLGGGLVLAAALCLPSAAQACNGPGGACGLLGGSCCSGSSCIAAICVQNPPSCQGEGGLCTSSSQCCGSRVCNIGFCRTPVGLGEACGPAAPCQSGLTCDPLSGFKCISDSAGLGEACGPLVHCTSGLTCDPLSGYVCISDSAGLGEACGPLVHCTSGLTCDPLSGFKCISDSAGLGEACGPLVHCTSGLTCDPLSGFKCIDDSAGLGEACGPLVHCTSGLTCDPLSGFKCIEATAQLGEACGPLVGCASGLACDPLAGFKCVENGVAEGQACGPLVQCAQGLFCDPLSGFRCVSAAGVDQACGPGVPCASGLQCTLALRCSHEPAQAGETCDATAPCGDGLFCQPGIPQRCQELKKPGEGCSPVNPCVAGASCEACFVDGCNAPFQCFYNSNQGAITENQCRALYSADLHKAAMDTGLDMTYALGDEAAAIVGESQAFGVSYGPDGRYGCYTTLCGGLNADISVEAFVSVGFYTDFDAVGGSSFVNVQEAQIPGDLLNFSTSQVFARDGIVPQPDLIGTEDALSIGVGPDILPFAAGSLLCETVLDTVIDPGVADPPVVLAAAVAPAALGNPGFAFGLTGWSCEDGGVCAWSDDDATGAGAPGSGQVTSPPAGDPSTSGRLASPCLRVTPGQSYGLSAWVRTLGARPGALRAEWNAGLDCDGTPILDEVVGGSPADDTWRPVWMQRRAPLGAQSLRLAVTAEREPGSNAPSTSRIDTVQVPEPASIPAAGASLLVLAGLFARRRGGRPRS